jgi:hypothetical protein
MLKIVSNLFVLIFALVFVYWGIKFVRFGWYQESELAELPFIFVACPLAGVSWVMASCKGPRGRRPGVKTVPDRGLTSAQALQPLAQLRQKSPKASIVRGSLKT